MQSRNVSLSRSSTEPLQRIQKVYGGIDHVEERLEQCILSAERRVRRGDYCGGRQEVEDCIAVLRDVSQWAALGELGGVMPRERERLTPLLTRVIKSAVCGGFATEEDSDGLLSDEVIAAASVALSNCGGGVSSQCADTTLEIQLDEGSPFPHQCEGCQGKLSVRFGFADYSEGETGARLWAGAVGLSLYLVEHVHRCWDPVLQPSPTQVPYCVIELGCGPGLVSLVAATLLLRHAPRLTHPVHLDVTDVSAAVVREVRHSFAEKNGPSLAALLEAKTAAARGVHVDVWELDFFDIPDTRRGQYHLLLASDIVYDYTFAKGVPAALESLLAPEGMAILCCEQHRDGMRWFAEAIEKSYAETLEMVTCADVTGLLDHLVMIPKLSESHCTLMIIRRKK